MSQNNLELFNSSMSTVDKVATELAKLAGCFSETGNQNLYGKLQRMADDLREARIIARRTYAATVTEKPSAILLPVLGQSHDQH